MNIKGIKYACNKNIIIYKESRNLIYYGVPNGLLEGKKIRVLIKPIYIFNIDTGEVYEKPRLVSSIKSFKFTIPLNFNLF